MALRCALGPLNVKETAAYIAGRIRVAGGEPAKLFTRNAVEMVHRCAAGLPRTINVICDNALVTGFAVDQRPVSERTVIDVCRDLDIKVPEPDEYPDRNVGTPAPVHGVEAKPSVTKTPVAFEQPSRRLQI